ncbi:hypothetical protein ACWGJ2_24780 [Streptomyces sp. NPDC054796]
MLCALLATAPPGASATAATAATGPGAATAVPRTETPVHTSTPDPAVAESAVRVRVPLPASAGPHPAACDHLSYLRFRDAEGPADSREADRVLIAQPGILEGAAAFSTVARNTVRAAKAKGSSVEFWALDRRSNCLEDRTGITAGAAAHDVNRTVGYYYGGEEIEGRTFDGFLGNDQVRWLENVGLEQTVRDQYDLMKAELPGEELRREKVLCGGHSLGGLLTGYFATWDFDGHPGYRQCGGYFALDTVVSTSRGGDESLLPTEGTPASTGLDDLLPNPGLGYLATQAGLRSGLIPRAIGAPAVINAETMNLLAIGGLASALDPEGESNLLTSVPDNANLNLTSRFMFSKDAGTFLTGTPSVRDFRQTNNAVLGGFMDDNAAPLAFIQMSFGLYRSPEGGRIVDKEFPASNDDASPVFGVRPKAIPDEPDGPLYTWATHDDIDTSDARWTNPGEEVTDIADLARSLSGYPLGFTEDYFPTKLATDVSQGDDPQIARFVKHPDGITANPTITLLAGNGFLAADPPEDLNPVIAEGYEHVDVLTAAREQNGGGPEVVSANLGEFAVSPEAPSTSRTR